MPGLWSGTTYRNGKPVQTGSPEWPNAPWDRQPATLPFQRSGPVYDPRTGTGTTGGTVYSPGYVPGGRGGGPAVGIEPWQMGGRFGQPLGLPNFTAFTGSTASPQPANPDFTLNPAPHAGTGPFGQVPGPLGVPDAFGNLSKPIPNLAQLNAGASGNILSNLHGQLSPDTLAAIQDAGARFGVASGMPGSGLAQNRTLRDVGLTSQQLQAQGVQQYNPFVSTVANTQTVRPETQIGVAETNAINASAPDPAAQSSYAEQLFAKYLESINPAGGTIQNQRPAVNTAAVSIPAPSIPFSPVAAPVGGGGVAARPSWQNYPWQGDNAFANTVNWGPQSYWKGR